MGEAEASERLARDAAQLLRTRGLLAETERFEYEALTGGVSSTLLRLRDTASGRSWCAKRPLRRLRVAGDWQVSPERAEAEARFLTTVGGWFPDAVPELLASDTATHLLVMEDLAPPRWRCWKPDLLAGRVDPSLGDRLGAFLGAIQTRAAAEPELAASFDNGALFHALRVRPFLLATAEAHRDRARRLRTLADDLAAPPPTLVHGDFSPKNLLVDDDGAFVLLDAECACWGAAHFDAAFLLSHLLLKWAHQPQAGAALAEFACSFREAWLQARGDAPGSAVDRRCTHLLPGLLLARLDGLSPVDYLDAERAARVRSFARGQLEVRPDALEQLLARYERAMGDID
ncbi:MAG: phosphotransferase [Pseudomonadales bacterium]|jgi:5-methylthioribose kinase|nr:phosphotransferase [Pseudomonadales bacterium]